jgi:hypothetical protein
MEASNMKTTPGLGDRYSDTAADLELVSSDEHTFYIPSYAFQASSSVPLATSREELTFRPVIRDMLTIDRSSSTITTKIINFADPDIETGVVIKSFLDICLYQEYKSLDGPVGNAIIGFVLKYEFKIELDRIELALFRQMQITPKRGFKYFYLAAALGNWPLCGSCIQSLSEDPSYWDQQDMLSRSDLCRDLDIRMVDLEGFKNISRFGPEFTLCLLKAGDEAKKGSNMDWQVMGKLFTQMMGGRGKSPLKQRIELMSSK